ncbi:hypothetical protein [Methylobacterium sp. A54F]
MRRIPFLLPAATLLAAILGAPARAEPRLTEAPDGTMTAMANLQPAEGCLPARESGRIGAVEREQGAISGFRLRAKRGPEIFVNTAPVAEFRSEATRAAVRRGYEALIRTGNRVSVGIFSCGASGSVNVLHAIAADKPATEAPPPAAAPQWRYGQHPVLGLTAHVGVGEDAFGLACGTGGATRGFFVRMSPRLGSRPGHKPSFALYFPGGGGMGGYAPTQEAGFLQVAEQGCGMDKYLRGREVLILNAEFVALEWRDRRTTLTIRQDGRPVTIRSDADLARVESPTRIPLAGIGPAVRSLIRACPMLRAGIAEGCDSGD